MAPEAPMVDDDRFNHPIVQQRLGIVQRHPEFSFLPAGRQETAFKVIVYCLFVLEHGLLVNLTAGFGKTFLYLAVIICNPVTTLIVTETSLVDGVITDMKCHLGEECVFRADTSKENKSFSSKATKFADAVKAAVASRTTGPIVVVAYYHQLDGIKQLLGSITWGQIFADETQHIRCGQHFKELYEISQGTKTRASFSGNHLLNGWHDVVRPMAWVKGETVAQELLVTPPGENQQIAAKIMSETDLCQLLQPDEGYYYKGDYELKTVEEGLKIAVRSKVVFLSLETVEEVLLQQLAEHVGESLDQRLAPADPLSVANRLAQSRKRVSSRTAQDTEDSPANKKITPEVRKAIEEHTDQCSARKGCVAKAMAVKADYQELAYPSIAQGIIKFVPTKLVYIVNDVQTMCPKDNIVIFCQFTSEVLQLAALFKAEGRRVFAFDPSGRSAILDWKTAANKGDGAILLGTPSLYYGHCLEEANKCYITTPHYSPYMDEQALRRLYRTGQKSPVVTLTRVFMKTKADESAYQIQAKKTGSKYHYLTQCVDTCGLLKIPRLSG